MEKPKYSLLSMHPATFTTIGEGAFIGYRITNSPVGRLMIAATKHGVCFLSLGEDKVSIAELKKQYPQTQLVLNKFVSDKWVEIVTAYLEGRICHPNLPLHVQGSKIQLQVWHELLQIPAGYTRTYSELAEIIFKKASARRVVGRSCAINPVSLVIPCHRVVRSNGGLGGYRWGIDRKKALIDIEYKRLSST